MTQIRGRVCTIQVAPPGGGLGVEYQGYRVRFDAKYGADSSSHSCTVVVSMPSPVFVGAVNRAGALIRLLAGYGDSPVCVAEGTVAVKSFIDRRGSTDPEVEFQITPSKLVAPVLGFSMPGPVLCSQIIERIRIEAGIGAGAVVLGEDKTLARGYVVRGPVRGYLQELADTTGSRWSLRDGQLDFWPDGESRRQAVATWAVASGLVDISGPRSDDDMEATALLRPEVRPGHTVGIDDPVYSGQIVVASVTHSGDTYGGNWYTTIVGRPLAA
jgi:hypothetical protein